MWEALHEIVTREGQSVSALVTQIDDARSSSSLTSAIRVHIVSYFRAAATEEGHRRSGHRMRQPPV
jgi:predicted DNA-binding ribbon-helix-helix protein